MEANGDCTPPSSNKLEGQAVAELRGPTATAESVWPLLEDFYGFHKWLPTIDTCTRVDGGEGEIRYCAATVTPPVKWCRERLLWVDPICRCLSYEVLENNIGLGAYESTIVVVPMDGGDGGCRIVWSFVAEAVEGLKREQLVGYLEASLQGMANNMEKALSQG